MKKRVALFLIAVAALVCVAGCEMRLADPVIDTDPPGEPDPAQFTINVVMDAISYYQTEGIDATLAYYNDPASMHGAWYVFITDENNIVLAQAASPNLVGVDMSLGVDGLPSGAEIVMAPADGHWVEYLWPNPDTDKLEMKRTWSIRHDGYLFGSGYYEPWAPDPDTLPEVSKDDPEAFIHAFVLEAVARYEYAGLEATLAHYNDPASIDGQWYIFMADATDTIVAHAPSPNLLGTDLKAVEGPDGYALGMEIAKATPTGTWIDYLWPNPATGETEAKRTWAIRHDNYLFGSGYYESLPVEAIPE